MQTHNDRKPGSVLLISMPFPMAHTPSIQLGTLSAYLKKESIAVETCHAYLDCLDYIGPEIYYAISFAMAGEILHPALMYPKHFNQNRTLFEKKFSDLVKAMPGDDKPSFRETLDRLSKFNQDLLERIDFSNYALIGFSTTYDQLGASVYLSREMKKRFPQSKIVFGGAHCTGDLGVGLLKTFSEIDFIVSGEGELTLAALLRRLDTGDFQDIPGLGWRRNGTITMNPCSREPMRMDHLPIPDYDEYFRRLEQIPKRLRRWLSGFVSLPLEGSRGCWWRKCSFCNLNAQYEHYRVKALDQILSEVETLVDRCACQSLMFVDNVQRAKGFGALLKGLADLKKDLNIFMEIRADRLRKDHCEWMRKAGVRFVQIGIEAFSSSMLGRMKKGVSVIENIAALKYCQENGILPLYNILIRYPNETQIDLEETRSNLAFLKSFVPPVSIHPVKLRHGSPIYTAPRDYNVKDFHPPLDGGWRFPDAVWQTLKLFDFDHTLYHPPPTRESQWRRMFADWLAEGKDRVAGPLLFYQDSGHFMSITDLRHETTLKQPLNGLERRLFLFCDSIQTRQAIYDHFKDIDPQVLDETLEKWIASHWMLAENDRFLSLAVKLNPSVSSLAYLAQYSPYYKAILNTWKPLARGRSYRFRLGFLADLHLNVQLKYKPPWLQRLKRRLKPAAR